jgi:uncharacterized protein YndB with AHSA1/START domain
VRVAATTTITASPERVWRFITVPENGPRWQEASISTHVTTPGSVGLGSEMVHEGRWLGMRIPTTAVVTVFEPPRSYGYDITTKLFSKPSPMRYTLEPVEAGTRLTLAGDPPVSAWLRPLEPLLQRNVQGMFERDVARLKALIESEPAPARPIGQRS